jgi:hypothetical protein
LCWLRQLGRRGEVIARADQDRAELAVLRGHRDQQPAQVSTAQRGLFAGQFRDRGLKRVGQLRLEYLVGSPNTGSTLQSQFTCKGLSSATV